MFRSFVVSFEYEISSLVIPALPMQVSANAALYSCRSGVCFCLHMTTSAAAEAMDEKKTTSVNVQRFGCMGSKVPLC
jgi:hypothetical protein